jgi:hypothetical protein
MVGWWVEGVVQKLWTEGRRSAEEVQKVFGVGVFDKRASRIARRGGLSRAAIQAGRALRLRAGSAVLRARVESGGWSARAREEEAKAMRCL